MMLLSKSDYMLSLKHPAWLWLKKHDKDKLPHIDDNAQATFDAGTLFEGFAERLFDDGVRLGFSDYETYLALPEQTMRAVLGGTKTIFQARFEHGQLTCISDVIEIVDEKTFNLYEIKSSTQVKPDHLTDLAFQAHVIRAAGFTVRTISVIHVDNTYVRQGEVNPNQLCTTSDVTDEVNNLAVETEVAIEKALAILSEPEMPNPSPLFAHKSAFSEWLTIYTSMYKQPPESIYELCGLNPKLLQKLDDAGIAMISDISHDFKLSPKQSKQVEATKLDIQLITSEPIRDFMRSFEYPLYFLDYETLAGVVPPFDNTRSYQQIPFQYSLHIIGGPDAELQHKEYLHKESTNPVHDIATSLREHIGDTGTVLAWNMGFEKSCNKLLAEQNPELSTFLLSLNDRMDDLMIPFSKLWFVDKKFKGSASIKKVLPALVPHLSYTHLGIKEGASAQRLWMQGVIDGLDTIDKNVLFADLIEYCKLDTLAMVEIYNVLRKVQ